jgi:nucleoporin NDC1
VGLFRRHQVCRYPYILNRTLIMVFPATPAPKPKSGGPVAPATPFIRKSVFRTTSSSPLHSVVESLAADGTVTQALEHSLDTTVAHLPDLFKSTGRPAPVAAVQKTVATVKAARPTLLEKIPTPSGLIPQKVQAATKELAQWWSRPRASRLADTTVPNRETDILVAEGRPFHLGHLVSESADMS